MRFPSSDEPDGSLPWILQKVFYLEPKVTPYEFMDIQAFEKLTQLLDIEHRLLRSEQEIASGTPLKSAEEVAAMYGIHKK